MAAIQGAGCLFKAIAGCTAFAAGSASVLLLAMPYTLGRSIPEGVIQSFNATHAGSIELRDVHVLDLLRPQRVGLFFLRDPEGRPVATGSLGVQSIAAVMNSRRLRLKLDLSQLDIVVGADGRTNLDRACERRTAGSFLRREGPEVNMAFSNSESLAGSNLLGLFSSIDVTVDSCTITDETFEMPALLELRQCVISTAGEGSTHVLGMQALVAGGQFDLRVEGLGWSDEEGRLRCNVAEASFAGNSCRSIEPWVERWTGIGPLSQTLGPQLGRGDLRFAESAEGLDGASVTLKLVSDEVKVQFNGSYSSSAHGLISNPGSGCALEFETGSLTEEAVLTELFPYLAGFADPIDDERSRLTVQQLTLPLGRERAPITAEFELELGYHAGVPSKSFREIAELASYTSWPLAEERLHFDLANNAVSFEVLHVSTSGAWTVHGKSALDALDVQASVCLPASHSATGEPVVVRVVLPVVDVKADPREEVSSPIKLGDD